MLSIKYSVAANLLSQSYVAILGIAVLPLYVEHLGAESYGLVGFYAVLNMWFQMLDMGLTPTVARESARFQGGSGSHIEFSGLVRSLEGIFLGTAIFILAVIFLSSNYLANHWLQTSSLAIIDVQRSIQIMGIIIATRWISGLYRGVIYGAEKILWLSSFNAVTATGRFLGVIPYMIYFGASSQNFFLYQLVIAFFELLGLFAYSRRIVPASQIRFASIWDWAPIKPILKFSLSVAFASVSGILTTQSDKLVLSRILALSDYGYYTIAVAAASAVGLLCGPVSMAIVPRLVRLEAESNYSELVHLYRKSTQFVVVLAGATSATLAIHSESILMLWTGNVEIVESSAPILALYAMGNCVFSIAAFPYFLQYAKGDLRLHLIGNIAYAVLFIPLIIFTSLKYGATGAAYTWLIMNLFAMVMWLPFVHRKFAPGINLRWYLQDVFLILSIALVAALLLDHYWRISGSIFAQSLILACMWLVTLVISACASTMFLAEVRRIFSTSHQNERKTYV